MEWEYAIRGVWKRSENDQRPVIEVPGHDPILLWDGLNDLGSKGWELAGIQPLYHLPSESGNIAAVYVFKRPRSN